MPLRIKIIHALNTGLYSFVTHGKRRMNSTLGNDGKWCGRPCTCVSSHFFAF